MSKTAYAYHPGTGEYLTEVKCPESPREPGQYLLPANATFVAPPEHSVNTRPRWDGEEWIAFLEDPAETLSTAKADKRADIYQAFVEATSGPMEIAGRSWDMGLTSITKIKYAIEHAERKGRTERKFYESDETPHLLSLDEANAVLLALSDDYDAKDAQMRAIIKAVNDATTVAEVEAINITFEVE